MKLDTKCYLVVGPGRCGTSTVARLLHTRIGVRMGGPFREKVPQNPDGFWEDLDFRDLNHAVCTGKITLLDYEVNLSRLVANRARPGKVWGVKDPRLIHVVGHYANFLPNLHFVRCCRPLELVARSHHVHYGGTMDQQREWVWICERKLDNFLALVDPSKITEVHFGEERSKDDEVVEQLSHCSVRPSDTGDQDG